MTIIDSGSVVSASASVLVSDPESANPAIGGAHGLAPVVTIRRPRFQRLAVNGDREIAVNRPATPAQGDARVRANHVLVFLLAHRCDERIFLRHELLNIVRLGRRTHAVEDVVPGTMVNLRRTDQGLRRHASDVDARPAERAALNEGDPRAKVRGSNGCGEPRGPAAQYHDIRPATGGHVRPT